MGLIADQELETYSQVYDRGVIYGASERQSPGMRDLPIFLDAIGDRARGTVLDAGCGTGYGSVALADAGFDVICADLVDSRMDAAQRFPFKTLNLWKPYRPQLRRGKVDWIYCADVFEHLPTQFVSLATDQMLRFCTSGAWISVCLFPEQYGIKVVGKQLHQTVKPFVWRRDTFREIGTVVEARDCKLNGCFLLEAA